MTCITRAGPSPVVTGSQERSPSKSRRRPRSARLAWSSVEWYMSTGALLGVKTAVGGTIRPDWTTSTLNPPSCKTAAVCHHQGSLHQSSLLKGKYFICFLLQQQLEDSGFSLARMYIRSRFRSRKGVYQHVPFIMCTVFPHKPAGLVI